MSTLTAKPHIRPRLDGSVSVEYRVPTVQAARQLNFVPTWSQNTRGWTSLFVEEGNTGDWQRNIVTRSKESILAFSPVYACISLIAGTISKLRMTLRQYDADGGIWPEIILQEKHGNDSTVKTLRLLRKPNKYQNRIQFYSAWVISKLLYGNTYVALQRDFAGDVVAQYVLDPCLVTPLVSTDGEVYYELRRDYLSKLDSEEAVIVPASEVIHDRMNCLWHPLVGVPPIYAAAIAAGHGAAIQANQTQFFRNASRPSGILMAPSKIDQTQADEIKRRWEAGFSGTNFGRTAVLDNAMTYIALTMAAEQSQVAEQLGLSSRDVATAFLVPPYRIGLEAGVTVANVSELDQDFYDDCLQPYMESIEICQREGLELDDEFRTKFDLDGLFRMDPLGQAEANEKRIGSGELSPNEARAMRDLPPKDGGDSLYMQQQNFSTQALAKRDARDDPFAKEPSTSPPPTAQAIAYELRAAMAEEVGRVTAMLPKPEPKPEPDLVDLAERFDLALRAA